jgi:hypothetical protein
MWKDSDSYSTIRSLFKDFPLSNNPYARCAISAMIPTVSSPVFFRWPLWKKLAFRFLFVFLVLRMALCTWLAGIRLLAGFYQAGSDWAVQTGNQHN